MKIRTYLHIGLIGCDQTEEIDIPDEEIEDMSEEEKEEYISQYAQDWANNYIDCGWTEIKE